MGEVGTMVETERAEESESSGETASRERPNMQNMGISLTRVVTGTKMVQAVTEVDEEQ